MALGAEHAHARHLGAPAEAGAAGRARSGGSGRAGLWTRRLHRGVGVRIGLGAEHVAAVAVERELGALEAHAQIPRLRVDADHLAADAPREARVHVGRVLPHLVRVDAYQEAARVLQDGAWGVRRRRGLLSGAG